jgi:hypothetical protein
MTENRFSKTIKCRHCSNHAPMLIAASLNRVQEFSDEQAPFDWSEGYVWDILECPACHDVMLRKEHWHSEIDTSDETKIVYPVDPGYPDGLPENIEIAYEAAQKVKSIDSNAFAVLLGRVLDLVCLDKNADGETLYARLKDIADKGIMPQQLADMAHQLRHLRNIGAHADLGVLTKAEIPTLESLSKAILEYVYSAPTLLRLVQEKIDGLKSNAP